ncbi:DeoR/GlpR family DNA-binding transcription regulator [Christensenella intestinihominis]|nr:DeoR/GlpR family DNA-binding transcription regulator [Christensenella intestinihominis]
MAKRSTGERRKELAEFLVTEGKVKVGALAERFGVSTETIRKDLIFLDAEGIVRKRHGSATIASGLVERSYAQKAQHNRREKSAVAKAAVRMIPLKGAVILDSGSTTYEIAKLLTLQSGLTIFTNSIAIIQLLHASHNRVFMFGGEIRPSSMALVGGWTVDALRLVEADIAFLGTDGFAGREGPCSASFEEVEVKRAIVGSGRKKILVCDHSKFLRSDMFLYCGFDEIDCVVTDEKAPAREIANLRRHTEVITADLK